MNNPMKKQTKKTMQRMRMLALATMMTTTIATVPALAQFSSGSNGSDGALNIPANSGTVIFDPVALGIDTDGDNVFHFTTITIAQGSSLKLKASKVRYKPVIFLAQGDVSIGANASIELSGENGLVTSTPVQVNRRPAEPGPGGYAGGLGSRTDTNPQTPASNGVGPAGAAGAAASTGCTSADSYSASSAHLNLAMIPLVGGAGGAGFFCDTAGSTGANGGAGGGALRLVSSTQIAFAGGSNSYIGAAGGTSSYGLVPYRGAGGGGMIHLIAPTITNAYGYAPSPLALGFNNSTPLAQGNGVVRFNGNSVTVNALTKPTAIVGALYNLPLPTNQPEVKITQVSGVNVSANPQGQVTGADVVINTPSASSVTIAAKYIPLGTVVKMRISSEVVTDQALDCTALSGTLASSTATCTATFPLGANITIATASW